MPTVKYETRQQIIAQVSREIQFARTYKQGKIKNWQINEDLYYGKKLSQGENSRANVDLARMQEFVHTLLSKIDNPLLFRFLKRKLAQLRRVEMLNALRVYDQSRDNWDIKDLVGKKQATIYGRAIFSYFADSEEEYMPHLDNVDVYDFLIDPAAGGIDIEKARYLGDYGVVLTRDAIKQGVKDKIFLKTEADTLLGGSGNSTEMNQEETNQMNRTAAQNTTMVNKEISDPDKWKFWRWGTTYEGKRYYVLFTERGGTAIRVEPVKDIFDSGLWWYWTYAVFPDLTEFWTPSYCDYVREIFMAQNVSINQALDNAEEINKPQKAIDVGAIKNLSELKYQRGGNYIKVTAGTDVNKALAMLRPPSIDTPIKVFELLEGIQEKSSGVTAAAKGISDEEKVGIYEGNQANTADRFGLLNKSYAFGYKRFAELYEWGVRQHLVKKTAVEVLGPDGINLMDVSRRDIFRKDEKFGIIVESSNAEIALSEGEKRTKIAFLNAEAQNPLQNQKKAYEIKAGIAGFDDDTVRALMDTSEFGDADVMSEADRDIERILDGEDFAPNLVANTAYKQRFVDYLRDHEEDLKPEQTQRIFAYINSLEPIIIANMQRRAAEQTFRMTMESIASGGSPPNEPAPRARKSTDGGEVAPVTELPPETTDLLATKA